MGTRSRCDRGRSTQHPSVLTNVGSRAWGRDLGAIEDARPNLRLTADVEPLRDPTSIGTCGCWVSRMGRDLGAIEDARPNLRLMADVEPLRDPTLRSILPTDRGPTWPHFFAIFGFREELRPTYGAYSFGPARCDTGVSTLPAPHISSRWLPSVGVHCFASQG